VTRLLLALVLGAAAAGKPTPAPGWVVVQRDGSLVQLAKEPTRKGNVLVGNLFPEGSLVSIRLEDVDGAKTAEANRVRKAGLELEPAKPLVQGAPTLGDRVRLAPGTGADAAHREMGAARKVLAEALKEKERFEQELPPGGASARAAWAQGLLDRKDAVDKARIRVDAARRRVDELAHAAR
jgi:hypothetical protein